MRHWTVLLFASCLALGAACKPQTPQGKLRTAIRSANVERVEAAIAEGANLASGFDDGQTALHLLATGPGRDDGAFVKYLVEHGVDPARNNDDGQTAWDIVFAKHGSLHEADVLFAVALLDVGFRPEAKTFDGGKTLLHEVARRAESAKIVEVLVEDMGLDPKARDENGWTPLHDAALAQNVPAATALLAAGADANAETTQRVGSAQRRGDIEIWRWRYDPGSRPLDVVPHSRGRFDADVRDVIREYGGTKNEAVDNLQK